MSPALMVNVAKAPPSMYELRPRRCGPGGVGLTVATF